jgi:AraC-like DNA-binding protein
MGAQSIHMVIEGAVGRMETPVADNYYEKAPFPGGRIVDRMAVDGVLQPWVSDSVRYVSRRWLGPVHIRAQGIEFPIRYVGVHEHIKSGRYPLHTHPHSEFLFTLSGHGTISLPHRKSVEVCKPGHVLAMPPGCAHQSSWCILPGDQPWRVLVANFDLIIDLAQVLVEQGDTVDLAFAPFYEWFFVREGEGIKMEGEGRDAVMAIMNEIAQSLMTRQYGVCSEIVAGLIRAIALFSRHIKQSGLADGTHVSPVMISKEAALLKARSLMEHSGFFEAGCVARVARTIGMSEAHFVREFKRYYGTTPKQYSLDVLMRRGAVLMSRTDIKVKDACFQLGFSDPTIFSRTFTRYHGVTPKEYHRRACSSSGTINDRREPM